MFSDVYDSLSGRLKQQRQEMWDHLKEYGHHYPMKDYEPSSDINVWILIIYNNYSGHYLERIDKDKMAYDSYEAGGK